MFDLPTSSSASCRSNLLREAFRVGVSGLGSIGRRHARLLAGLGVREVCLYDVVPDELELPVELAPLASWAHSFDELLDPNLTALSWRSPMSSMPSRLRPRAGKALRCLWKSHWPLLSPRDARSSR